MGFVGILLVLAAVLGGYLMEGGEVGVLIQPAELVIIMGAALGSVLISTPLKVIIEILQSLTKVLTGAAVSKTQYFELLSVMYELFQMARRDGQLALEPHIEDPEKSSLFGKYPGPHNIPFGADVIDKAMNVASLYLQYEDPRSTMGQQPGPPNTEDFCRGNLRARRRRSRNERRQRAADRRPACRARLSTR